MKKFNFPAITTTEQVDILSEKGLLIPDKEDARKFLDYIPYGKILSYMMPYRHLIEKQRNGEQIDAPITRDIIKSTYLFDHKMRILFFEYLSFIELSIKSMFVNISCNKYGTTTWWVEVENFSAGKLPGVLQQYKNALDYYWKQYHIVLADYQQYITANTIITSEEHTDKHVKQQTIKYIKSQLNTAKTIEEEEFLKTIIKILDKEAVNRYIEQYHDPLYPPIRNIVEELTFGDITYVINSVVSRVKKRMLQKINISKDGLESGLKALVDLRNICCHHGKLYTHLLPLHHDLLKKILPSSPNESIHDLVKHYSNFFVSYSFMCYVLEKVDPNMKQNFITRIYGELKNKNKLYLLDKRRIAH